MKKITPFLWFDNQAEEAMNFYVSIFPDSKVLNIVRYGDTGPGPKGSVLTADFEITGQRFTALNGGPMFKFNESVSFVISCESQEEIDKYWNTLTANGGEESQCGWLKDKYGLSWQVVPTTLSSLLGGNDPEKSGRVMNALLKMRKLDLNVLTQAYKG